VEAKRQELESFVTRNWRAIESERMVVFFVDECHLHWGNAAGYIWGPKKERAQVVVPNEQRKQTYFGALNAKSGRMTVQSHPTGNSERTIAFLETLRAQHPGQQIVVIWDGAPYHRSWQAKQYLDSVNGNLPPEEWKFICFRLAPNAPEQNPIEKVWLRGKETMRKLAGLCPSFERVKALFRLLIEHDIFKFSMLRQYGFVHV